MFGLRNGAIFKSRFLQLFKNMSNAELTWYSMEYISAWMFEWPYTMLLSSSYLTEISFRILLMVSMTVCRFICWDQFFMSDESACVLELLCEKSYFRLFIFIVFYGLSSYWCCSYLLFIFLWLLKDYLMACYWNISEYLVSPIVSLMPIAICARV